MRKATLKTAFLYSIIFIGAIFFAGGPGARGQEDWEGNDPVWNYNGMYISYTEATFGPDSSILFNYPSPSQGGDIRLMIMNYRVDENPRFHEFLPESLSTPNYDDYSPFLTSDGRSLYFVSDRPGGYGESDIWVTHFINGAWTMPANIGQGPNSSNFESNPSLTGDGSEIYFVRTSPDNIEYGKIYRSILLGEEWSLPEFLPYPVNSPFSEFDCFISVSGDRLYFLSTRSSTIPRTHAWVAYRAGPIWENAVMIDGFINTYWNDCQDPGMDEGRPLSIAVDTAGLLMIYPKMEIYQCLDVEYNVYLSYAVTTTSEDENPKPECITLSAYPNPFNSATTISYQGLESGGNLHIYDITGRLVWMTDIAESDGAIVWDATDLNGKTVSSGMYMARVSNPNHSQEDKTKLIYLK
jgi:hypothetical protein